MKMNGGLIFRGELSVGEDTKMVEIVLKVPAIEKLMDYLASGFAATAGPLLLPWRAYMEGHAKRISARAYADAMPLIAQAQAEVRTNLVAPGADEQAAVTITHENLTQLIESQGRKRLANIVSVVENAAEGLGEKEVIDHEPDHDWTARFFDCVQDVSSEHMQRLWAKVLSGEVESSGRTSLRTLDTLRNMTKRDAELFEGIAGYVIEGEFIFYNSEVEYRHRILSSYNLVYLEDCGLINIVPSLAKSITWKDDDDNEIELPYHGSTLLIVRSEGVYDNLEIPTILLTIAGRELLGIVKGTVQMTYLQDFSSFLDHEGCRLSLLQGAETLSDGRHKCPTSMPIEPRFIPPGMPAL